MSAVADVASGPPGRTGARTGWQSGAVTDTTRAGGLLRGWSEPEKFDAYTRWTLYLFSATEPVVLVAVASGRAWSVHGVVLAGVLGLAHTVACLTLLRDGLRRAAPRAHGAPGVARRRVVAVLALAVLTVVVVAVGSAPAAEAAPGVDVRVAVGLVVAAATLAALSPLLRAVALLAALVVVNVASLLVQVAIDGTSPADVVVRTSALTVATGAMLLSYRASAWMVGVVWELDRSRVVEARLAVAEERLRFSRDLHDVVGRALTAVSVKSELAAELASRGRPGAADQMLEVRDLAHETLREVRAVVEGYRAPDLAAELVGARSVLRSAGVETRVEGEDIATGLDADVAAAFGWVVREGVTNVVRHADAGSCVLTLAQQGDVLVLRIVNDRARPRTAADRTGSGLRGLAERLAPLAGSVTTSADGDGRFVLEACVPARTEVAA